MHDAADIDRWVDLQNLSKLLGKDLIGLLGADTLKGHVLTINWLESKCYFDEDCPTVTFQHTQELEFAMGIPLLTVTMARESFDAFFDTGAQISYISKEQAAGLNRSGIKLDFHPYFGSFSVNMHSKEFELFGKKIVMEVGSLPQNVEDLLLSTWVKIIIGNDIFETFPVIQLDYKQNSISVSE